MSEVLTLILLCLAMLIGCYLAGSVPLAFSLSESSLKTVTVFGAGLLVGTALAVIIPEGVHALISMPEHPEHHHLQKAAVESGKLGTGALKLNAAIPASQAGNSAMLKSVSDHSAEAHSLIGVALVLGFVFMLLVDQIGGNISHSPASENGSGGQTRNRLTATLGLVIHAAADGVALGAAASTSHTHVEIIVFIAIMLHKAPAAFGLVSFLLHEGFERNRIRRHLAVFAVSAPLFALITYFGLSQSSKKALSDINATGLAMLFSGGTFLYVATVHILPEVASMGVSASSSSSSYPLDGIINGHVTEHSHKGFTRKELVVIVIGCLLPLILAIGHNH